MANETIPDLTAGTPPFVPGTLVELAVPDGLGGFVSRKGQLADVVGMTPLARGTITDPVTYFDLALPAGYSQFILSGVGFTFSETDSLVAAFSYDGGVTFWNDTEEFDSYTVALVFQYQSDTGNIVGRVAQGDSVMQFGIVSPLSLSSLKVAAMFDVEVDPGSSSTFPLIRGVIDSNPSNGSLRTRCFLNTINPDSTIPAAVGRVNLMRVLPYGNGDVNPPTSGVTITAGSWTLWGVPA